MSATIERNVAMIKQFWIDLYSHDFAKVGTYFTADAEYDDVPIPAAKVHGPAAIVRKLEIGLGKVLRHQHHLERMVADETTVVTEHAEDWVFAEDHIVTLPFVSIQVIEDGKIKLWRDYSNMDTLLTNAPPWWLEHIAAAWAA